MKHGFRQSWSKKLATSALGVLLVTIPTSTIASASTWGYDVAFESQYNANLRTENNLFAIATSVPSTTSQMTSLKQQVTELNRQVSQLYTLYHMVNGPYLPTHSARNVHEQMNRTISTSIRKIQAEWSRNTHQIYVSFYKRLSMSLARNSNSHMRFGIDRDLVARLESTILALQNISINETKLWITLEHQSAPSWYDKLSISPSATVVSNGQVVVYNIQVQNYFFHPLNQSGLKINVSLTSGNNDGALQTTTVYTDSQGRASVPVVAGYATGNLQISAQVDGSNQAPTLSPVVHVVNPSTVVTHLVLSGPALPTSVYAGQSLGGSTDLILPENSNNQILSGDTLTVRTSNTNILAPTTPDSTGGNTVTLHPETYVMPSFTAKAPGVATITIRDETQYNHPTLTYTVNVMQTNPVSLVAVNPAGSQTSYDVLSPGLVGPFKIVVEDASSNVVATPAAIDLTAAQVNQLIGIGNGIRLSPTGPDVSTVTIPAHQSTVTLYADNAPTGWTNPTRFTLSSLVPYLSNAQVVNSSTIRLDYSQVLNSSSVPTPSDFVVNFGWGSGTPKSVLVSGKTVTIHMWGNTFSRHQAVSLSYTWSSEAHPLKTYWGANIPAFSNLSVRNPL